MNSGFAILPAALRLAYAIVERVARARLTVLIFHRVVPQPDPLNPTEPDAVRFAELMELLAHTCNVVDLADGVRRFRDSRLPSRAVAITFDDGYADNATIAMPILLRLGITATFFVSTSFLNGGRMWNDTVIETLRRSPGPAIDLSALGLGVLPTSSVAQRSRAADSLLLALKYLPHQERELAVTSIAERAGTELPADLMMTSTQVRALAQAGMGIGAHTLTHPILTRISDDAADHEIRASKLELEYLLDREVTLFAYPNGSPQRDFGARHVAMVRAAGFLGAVSTAHGVVTDASDAYQLPRYTPWRRTTSGFALQLIANLANRRPALAQA